MAERDLGASSPSLPLFTKCAELELEFSERSADPKIARALARALEANGSQNYNPFPLTS